MLRITARNPIDKVVYGDVSFLPAADDQVIAGEEKMGSNTLTRRHFIKSAVASFVFTNFIAVCGCAESLKVSGLTKKHPARVTAEQLSEIEYLAYLCKLEQFELRFYRHLMRQAIVSRINKRYGQMIQDLVNQEIVHVQLFRTLVSSHQDITCNFSSVNPGSKLELFDWLQKIQEIISGAYQDIAPRINTTHFNFLLANMIQVQNFHRKIIMSMKDGTDPDEAENLPDAVAMEVTAVVEILQPYVAEPLFKF